MVRNISSIRNERNRKERKARYISLNNKMRKYPSCNYGEFFCNHVYDSEFPWQWVDFSFYHSKLRRYYAVSMLTLNYSAWCETETKMFENERLLTFNNRQERIDYSNKYFVAILNTIIKGTPSIELVDYGPVVIGLWATVNSEHIDEHIIRDFIRFFRDLGEPTTPGWNWRGEEEKINPTKLL